MGLIFSGALYGQPYAFAEEHFSTQGKFFETLLHWPERAIFFPRTSKKKLY